MPSDKRERESREIWAKRVDTGLTSGEFCAELDINPRTLMYWAWRLRKDGKQRGPVVKPEKPKAPTASAIQPNRKRTKKPSPPPSFMELVPTPPSEGQPVEIIVRSVTVRVPQTAAADLVRRAFEFAEKQK